MSSLRFARTGVAALAAALAILSALPGVAAPVRTERVTAELLADRSAALPGQPVTVGLRLVMDKGWHTYWRNPGDSGLPTRIAWTLPEGWTAGPIQWPYPEAQRVGPLMNYGYSNEVVLLSTLTPPASAAAGPVTLTAKADWLVCEDICIPEKATLTLALPVASDASQAKPANASLFDKARASLPVEAKGWRAESSITGNTLSVRLTPPAGVTAPSQVSFFPFRENFVDHPAEQRSMRDGDSVRLTVTLVEPVAPGITEAAGVFVAGSAWPGLGTARAIEIAAPMVASLPPAPAGSASPELGGSLLLALLLALAGGALLNLMPCVFPVLGIKVMGFVQHAHGDNRALRLQGVVFTLGVLVSFVALAGLLLALRAGGAQLGWGFQLQSPAFVTALAALFLLMGLNLFGVFEWGGFAQSLTSNLSARGRYGDAFLAGVLATAVATPCTAPFMGAAVGFTLAQPAATALLVFAVLGLGMALPVLLLSFFPAALKKLPKPGPWMETFKQLMAFPLLGTVVWLAWVLGAQAGNDAVLALLAGLLLLAMAAWVYGRWAHRAGMGRVVAAGLLAAIGIAIAWPGSKKPASGVASGEPAARQGEVNWQPWTPERFAELRAAGTPVFIDFTAAWCVTCQVNKRVALNREVVAKAMAERGVVALQADWTNYDPRITAALAELGRNALPVYALYAPGEAKPKLLPEVLTASLVVDEILKLPAPRVAAATTPSP